jgi:thiol-disulfide isomerase/thioredoxin
MTPARARRLFLCLLALLPLAAPAAPPSGALEGLDGKMHPLADYIGRGKWVALNIWGPRCPPCVEEMPELQRFHDRHHANTAIVLGLAIDFPSYGYAKKDQVSRFLDDYFITFPVLLADGRLAALLNGGADLEGTPTTLMFRPDGTLVARQVGKVTEKLLSDYIAGQTASGKP